MRTIGFAIYRQNGGSGLGLTYNDCMGLAWADIIFFVELLQEFREAEAKANRG